MGTGGYNKGSSFNMIMWYLESQNAELIKSTYWGRRTQTEVCGCCCQVTSRRLCGRSRESWVLATPRLQTARGITAVTTTRPETCRDSSRQMLHQEYDTPLTYQILYCSCWNIVELHSYPLYCDVAICYCIHSTHRKPLPLFGQLTYSIQYLGFMHNVGNSIPYPESNMAMDIDLGLFYMNMHWLYVH